MAIDFAHTGHEPTYYASALRAPERPPLIGSHGADALVIGAGYAGIAAATEFLRQGCSVILLERGRVGAGASGRNGGILLLSEGKRLDQARAPGKAPAALRAAAGEFAAAIQRDRLDVELSRGSVRLALTRHQACKLASAARGSVSVADPGRVLLDRGELRSHVRSDLYRSGLLETDSISVNPHALLEGLAQSAEQAGAVIAEGSAALEIGEARGGRLLVRTARGEVSAARLVVAAGIGIGSIVPTVGGRLLVGHSQMAVTAPIPSAVLDAVIPGAESFSESTILSRYFRRLPGNRLLFGFSSALRRLAPGQLETRIRNELQAAFPSLAEAPFDFAWSGETATTREETPLLERIGRNAVVISSNGVLASWHGGKVAAIATDARYADYDAVRGGGHGRWPPLGLPEGLVRSAGNALFRVLDRL